MNIFFNADQTIDDQYLLKTKEKVGKLKPKARKSKQSPEDGQSSVDLQQRLEIIRNKMQSKKTKPSARAIEKKKQKKLKKTKELKKKLISVAKSIKNEKVKEGKSANTSFAETESNGFDVKPEIKPDIKPAKVFNEEGKMVFSKFEFAAQASRAKKTKKDSKQKEETFAKVFLVFNQNFRFISETIKDPKLLLKKLKKEKEQINELVSQGEVDKAEELKKNIAWQKAFDKTEGKKVCKAWSWMFIHQIVISKLFKITKSNSFVLKGERQRQSPAQDTPSKEGGKEEVEGTVEATWTESAREERGQGEETWREYQ